MIEQGLKTINDEKWHDIAIYSSITIYRLIFMIRYAAYHF